MSTSERCSEHFWVNNTAFVSSSIPLERSSGVHFGECPCLKYPPKLRLLKTPGAADRTSERCSEHFWVNNTAFVSSSNSPERSSGVHLGERLYLKYPPKLHLVKTPSASVKYLGTPFRGLLANKTAFVSSSIPPERSSGVHFGECPCLKYPPKFHLLKTLGAADRTSERCSEHFWVNNTAFVSSSNPPERSSGVHFGECPCLKYPPKLHLLKIPSVAVKYLGTLFRALLGQ